QPAEKTIPRKSAFIRGGIIIALNYSRPYSSPKFCNFKQNFICVLRAVTVPIHEPQRQAAVVSKEYAYDQGNKSSDARNSIARISLL
ncbi:MAG TPA: hypothetical protein VFS77_17085, partial [Pyrinomonadaceae bacterium]|nr:hypothetical protein [Pyrinomonadaceae bacterium]